MIQQIIIIALIVFSIWFSMQEGEIFGKLGGWLEYHLPGKLHKPIFACHICMTPWYGTGLYFLLPLLPEWIPIVIAAMGVNAMITKLWPKDEIDVTTHGSDVIIDFQSDFTKEVDLEKEAQDMYV